MEVTTGQAAKICGVSQPTILNHIKKPDGLPARKRLHQNMIDTKDLRKWAEKNGLKFDMSNLE